MNTVFTNISGQGEPLVVLHGWGMNHTAWLPIKSKLERLYQVTWVDLPGHGNSKEVALGELDAVVDVLLPLLPLSNKAGSNKPVNLMGWSMGGLIAQRLAERFPDHVRSLTLVATSPSFIQRDNWSHAMPQAVLNSFVNSLEKDFSLTIKRFLALQFMGVKGVQADVKKLRDAILKAPPHIDALRAGLTILNTTDLRDADIKCPQHWILGAMDRLVPAEVESDISVINSNNSSNNKTSQTKVTLMPDAGHAPFISHPESFVSHVDTFLSSDSF